MTPTWLYVVSETIPNWLTAIAALLALGTFLLWKRDKADAHARRVEEIGGGVHARWVILNPELKEARRWGVLIVNELTTPIRDVEITCLRDNEPTTLSVRQVAPGRHFVGAPIHGGWDFPEPFNPTTASKDVTPGKFDVALVRFGTSGRRYERGSDGLVKLA